MTTNSDSDIIFISQLSSTTAVLNLNDHWGRSPRTHPLPLCLSIYLLLPHARLTKPGISDDVRDSIDYSSLSKSIMALLSPANIAVGKPAFVGVRGLVDAIARQAESLVFASATADTANASDVGDGTRIRVVVEMEKKILLASAFDIDIVQSLSRGRGEREDEDRAVLVSIKDLVLPVIIGVNAAERLARQRVITNITIREVSQEGETNIDYTTLVDQVVIAIESSGYLTLEKFVYEIVALVCRYSEDIATVTVRAQKPSALSFARASGVELTRRREEVLT